MNSIKITLSTDSVLIMNEKGLERMFCPFLVIALRDFELINKGEIIPVQYVTLNKDYPLLYMINGELYPFNHFGLMDF